MAQVDQELLEQGEGLRLVLVERIALAVAAQADDLTQVVEVLQVLAPLQIDHLQHEALFELAHAFGAHRGLAVGGAGVSLGGDALDEFLGVDAVLLRPFMDRQGQAEHAEQALLQPVQIPLFGIGLGGQEAVDEVLNRVAAHL